MRHLLYAGWSGASARHRRGEEERFGSDNLTVWFSLVRQLGPGFQLLKTVIFLLKQPPHSVVGSELQCTYTRQYARLRVGCENIARLKSRIFGSGSNAWTQQVKRYRDGYHANTDQCQDCASPGDWKFMGFEIVEKWSSEERKATGH